jgi:hypothetical protein
MDDLENAANGGESGAAPGGTGTVTIGPVSTAPLQNAAEFGAIGVKHTSVDKTGAWDAGANLKRLGDKPTKASLRAMHAWVDPAKDQETKAAYKLPHHNVSADGKVGAANMKAVASAMGRLNGGGLDIPQADRKGVYDHLAAHYKDAGMTAPDLKASADAHLGPFFFGAEDEGDDGEMAEFVPSTADADKGTIDCVWYGGQTVPRIDYSSGETYMLKLDMEGCRMDRLNSGAPVFDNHMTGSDFKSVISGKAGTRAQIGVVQNAWTDGEKGMATLKFDLGSEDGAEMFRKVAGGIVRNLSFGAWINETEKTEKEGEITQAVATDWEPFEISPVGVPADYSTQFLSADGRNPSRQSRGNQPKGDDQMDETKLAAARDEGNKEGLKAGAALERQRMADIRTMAAPFKLDEKFLTGLIDKGLSLEDSRKEVMTELAARAEKDANGKEFHPRAEFAITRDANDTRLSQMQAALLLRHNGQFFMAKKMDHKGDPTGQFQTGNGPEQQRKMEDLGREYRGFSLLEMAKESLTLRGINPRGMSKMEVARRALEGNVPTYFSGGAESTSDFPSILANVANKTLRLAYEAYPRTFEPFSRQVTAQDFKPVNRVQLSDAPALEKLNEEGEFRRAKLSDTNQNYSLATFGKIVAITRKVIINDDLQAFTRVPAILGVAAARLESDTVWAVITGNQTMAEDLTALFHTSHKNSLTGTGSSIDPAVNTTPISAMNAARAKMRLQKAQQGTPLNLVPRFAAAPAALESYLLQLLYPINIASSDSTKVVPEWVRSLVPVIEPRLDAASATAWYMIADPAQIDTVEHCYLEGQEGVYIETKQGFDVDGLEIKARMDFAAAAIDFRGMQKNAGA